MPTYNHVRYIGEAIRSVLNQTYPDWELIIVDDGSTDSTGGVVAHFDDTRLRYVYQTNKGVSEARNVGIATSSGEFLAFLDADDMYHPGKLETQVVHLDRNPETGLVYGLRIENDQDGKPLKVCQPPAELSLEDLLLRFPLATCDFMVRRDWVERVGGFNKSFIVNEDRDLLLRLALTGCRFKRVDRLLAYRRRHVGRRVQDLPAKLNDIILVLDTAFNDPRCPREFLAVSEHAYRNVYLEWAFQASIKDETSMAQAYFREMLRFDPSITENNADELLQFLVDAATRDGGEHETRLRKVFAQLPSELQCLSKYCDWTVACGYLLRGVRDVMWDRMEMGKTHFRNAAALGAQLDKRFFWLLRYQLMNYEAVFGPEATQTVLCNLSPYLKKVGGRTSARRLKGWYWLDLAFRNYDTGKYAKVLGKVMRAVVNNPKYLVNRKMLTILYRSVIAM